MNKIIAKRGRAKGCITNALSYVDSIDETTTLSTLEFRLNKLEETWQEFVSLQNDLLDHIDAEGYVDRESEYAEYEEKYFRTHVALSNAILNFKKEPSDDKLSPPQGSGQENDNEGPIHASVSTQYTPQDIPEDRIESATRPAYNPIQLPKITIEPFSGDYKDWPTFRDMFLGTVDSNSTLSSVQKLHFLKSFLRGRAADLISHVKCSKANYVETWDRLERRYDQRHLIVKSFIDSFISLPNCSNGNIGSLNKIADGAEEVVRGLNALDCNSRDPWLIYILHEKLDFETKKEWAAEKGSRDDHTIDDFLDFLQGRCRCLETCQPIARPSQNRAIKSSKAVLSHVIENRPLCLKCKKDHLLSQCPEFKALTVAARREFTKNSSLCFNCLRQGHSSRRCRSNSRCSLCNARHHNLVHPCENTSSLPSDSFSPHSHISNDNSEQPVIANHSVESSRRTTTTILPTAVARIKDKSGIYHNVRMLLDSGSQASFVTEGIVRRLVLSRKRSRIPILGIASASAGVTNGLVSLNLLSNYSAECINVDCHVLPKLTSNLPVFSMNHNPQNFVGIELADPTYYEPGPIDILIGADKFFDVIKGGSKHIPNSNLMSIPTIFGCIIAGGTMTVCDHSEEVTSFHTSLDYSQEFDLERFWKLEEILSEIPLSVEEQLAEDLFVKNTTRRVDGRYEVALPFKPSMALDFGNSLGTAISRFNSLDKRFKYNEDLRSQYCGFINEYLALGHMEGIPPDELKTDKNVYYLPHHAIFKNDSTTTKIRIVFDASARSNNSISLNDSLLVGPTIQHDLFSICLRYRLHQFVISGDIEKMYRQIWIRKGHTDFQRIVWRSSPTEPLKHYRLLTVTYGTASAPFSAIRVLKQLALDSSTTHPLASKALLNDFYVDDVVTGADSADDVCALQSELVDLLGSGGFNLRKWTSNCHPLLLRLPEDQRELSPVDFENSNSVKILGLQWCPSRDCFSYRVKQSNSVACTKRRILSDASRLFDPLGFLAPVIVGVKIMFQELWRRKLNWDDEVPRDLALQWTAIRDELPTLESLSIPRLMVKNKLNWELHGFCDASLDAYAASVYCRSISSDATISVQLVAAKSRVAPLKVLSLPRLELCGALLLTRLINKIKLSLQEPDIKTFAWTDSSIVLHWLSAPPKKWSVFIANRTSEILSSIHFKQWNHVPTASNPADLATRGISPTSLASASLWWNGPIWLSQEVDQWPVSSLEENINIEQLEERKVSPTQVFVSNIYQTNFVESLIQNASNWFRLIRVVAYALRYIDNYLLKNEKDRNFNPLSTEELNHVKTKLIKCAQMTLFRKEIELLKSGKDLPPKNKLRSLSPFIDACGVLRVGGRLENSELSYSEKHPIILCSSHHISKLIVNFLHEKHLHPGVSLLFALTKQNYYILGCRNLTRKIVHDCIRCFRERLTTTQQLMGNLPVERIRYSRPFSKVGCDYAGPLMVRSNRGRNPKFTKCYISLFVCFVTKAIHIELVGDLSSTAFLLALDRFVARRGKPYEIWSDNGTNFRVAKRLLDEMHKLLWDQHHNTIVADHLANDGIDWKFIPPSAPHFGGLWEAGVKSVKLHLKRVIGESKLTYEELYTLLVKIESLLNSRPMWATADSDTVALSPAHFLIGERYTSVPQPSVPNSIIPMTTNWSLLQAMLQGFWTRWHREYLTSLQHRPKWQISKPNLRVDDVVLLKEANLPPSKWIIGRITQTHPGEDEKVRVVTVKTKFGEYLRPVVKVSPLPFSERP